MPSTGSKALLHCTSFTEKILPSHPFWSQALKVPAMALDEQPVKKVSGGAQTQSTWLTECWLTKFEYNIIYIYIIINIIILVYIIHPRLHQYVTGFVNGLPWVFHEFENVTVFQSVMGFGHPLELQLPLQTPGTKTWPHQFSQFSPESSLEFTSFHLESAPLEFLGKAA